MYSVGCDDDRRRSARVTPALRLNGVHGPTSAHRESPKFLKEVVQRSSRSYGDDESIDSQRTDSDAASGNGQPAENFELEVRLPFKQAALWRGGGIFDDRP